MEKEGAIYFINVGLTILFLSGSITVLGCWRYVL